MSHRLSCGDMLKHPYYQENNFCEKFLLSLKEKVEKETASNPFFKSLSSQKSKKLYNTQSQKEPHATSISPNKNTTTKQQQKTQQQLQEKKNQKNSLKAENSSSTTTISQEKTTAPPASYQHCPKLVSSSLKTVKQSPSSMRNEQNFSKQQNNNNNPSNALKKFSDLHNSDRVIKESSKTSLQNCMSTPDSKIRGFLDMSINQPGKNLPEISSSVNINR